MTFFSPSKFTAFNTLSEKERTLKSRKIWLFLAAFVFTTLAVTKASALGPLLALIAIPLISGVVAASLDWGGTALVGWWAASAAAAQLEQFADPRLGAFVGSCWTCPIVVTVFDGIVAFGYEFYQIIAPATSNLLILIFAFWILFYAAKAFMPFGPMLDAQAWNTLIWRFILAMLIFIVLLEPSFFWEWAVIPIMQVGTNFALLIFDANTPVASAMRSILLDLPLVDCAQIANDSSGTGFTSSLLGALDAPPEVKDAIIGIRGDMVCHLGRLNLAFGEFLGHMIMGTSVHMSKAGFIEAVTGAIVLAQVIQVVSLLIILVIYFIAIFILLAIVLDAFLRIGYVAMFSPIMFAAALFPQTRNMFIGNMVSLLRASALFFFSSLATFFSLIVFANAVGVYFTPDNMYIGMREGNTVTVRTGTSFDTREGVSYYCGTFIGMDGWENTAASTEAESTGNTIRRQTGNQVWYPPAGPGGTGSYGPEYETVPDPEYVAQQSANIASQSAQFQGLDLLTRFNYAARGNCFRSYGVASFGYWSVLGAGVLTIFLLRQSRSMAEQFIDSLAGDRGKAGGSMASQGLLMAKAGAIGAGAVAVTGAATVTSRVLGAASSGMQRARWTRNMLRK